MLAGEADDFARNILGRGLDDHPRADRHGVKRPGDFHHQATHADHAAVDFDAVEIVDLLCERLHGVPSCRRSPTQMVTRGAILLSGCLPGTLIIAPSPLWRRNPRLPDGGESFESVSADT